MTTLSKNMFYLKKIFADLNKSYTFVLRVDAVKY